MLIRTISGAIITLLMLIAVALSGIPFVLNSIMALIAAIGMYEMLKAGGIAKPAPVQKSAPEPDLFAALTVGNETLAADQIRSADLNTMTPIEAMNLLFNLKKLLS